MIVPIGVFKINNFILPLNLRIFFKTILQLILKKVYIILYFWRLVLVKKYLIKNYTPFEIKKEIIKVIVFVKEKIINFLNFIN